MTFPAAGWYHEAEKTRRGREGDGMRKDERVRLRLAGLAEGPVPMAALLGVQSQFLRCSRWAAGLRGIDLDRDETAYFRAWTLRGTMHIHAAADYGLYMHEGNRSPYIREYWADDTLLSAGEKERAAERMLRLIESGVTARKDIMEDFRQGGAAEAAMDYLFNAWGGLPRVLMERGQIVQTVSEELRYRLAPQTAPLAAEEAELEQMRRYLAGYAPCGVEDAAYFFRYGKGKCRKLMEAASAVSAGRLYWEDGLVCRRDAEPGGQGVYVLPSFDPLLVGYEKKTNPMVPPEYLRDIYTLQGIIRPVIVAGGQCAAVWQVKRETVYVRPFRDSAHIPAEAEEQLLRLTGCGAVVYE